MAEMRTITLNTNKVDAAFFPYPTETCERRNSEEIVDVGHGPLRRLHLWRISH
jgi:hypothetical protein